MDEKFRQAVSWAYHAETDDEIRNTLGYKGDLETVKAVAELLDELEANHDIVHDWSKM